MSFAVERFLYAHREEWKPTVYATLLGDVAGRVAGVTAALLKGLESVAVATKELSGFVFLPLAGVFSSIFGSLYCFSALKTLYDGFREFREFGRQGDKRGQMVGVIRMVQGSIMGTIGLGSVLVTFLYAKALLAVNVATPVLQTVGDMVTANLPIFFAVYTLAEWVGSVIEMIKFYKVRGEIQRKEEEEDEEYVNRIFNFLARKATLSEDERAGLTPQQQEKLRLAKEDAFIWVYGRELFTHVKKMAGRDEGGLPQNKELVPKSRSEAIWGRELVIPSKQEIVEYALEWNQQRKVDATVNFVLFTFGFIGIVVCFAFMGGIPALAGTLVLGSISLILTCLNTIRIFKQWKTREIGKIDLYVLAFVMTFTVFVVIAGLVVSGAGPAIIAIFVVTTALGLLIQGTAFVKLYNLRKKRIAERDEELAAGSRVRELREIPA